MENASSGGATLLPTIEERLVARYGELMTIRELRLLLRVPDAASLRSAIAIADWPLYFPKVGGNYMATTRDIARCLVEVGFPVRPGTRRRRNRPPILPGGPCQLIGHLTDQH
ncbi:MAG: hypothetical protein KF796_04410 [Ramlibacter sp.]|nr:hypothetical protein [Ramlibacter sp.]